MTGKKLKQLVQLKYQEENIWKTYKNKENRVQTRKVWSTTIKWLCGNAFRGSLQGNFFGEKRTFWNQRSDKQRNIEFHSKVKTDIERQKTPAPSRKTIIKLNTAILTTFVFSQGPHKLESLVMFAKETACFSNK